MGKKIKLSSAQIAVLEKMVENKGAVIRPNGYYHGQEVQIKGQTIHYFKKPTLEFLVRHKMIVKQVCGLYDLNPEINFNPINSKSKE